MIYDAKLEANFQIEADGDLQAMDKLRKYLSENISKMEIEWFWEGFEEDGT